MRTLPRLFLLMWMTCFASLSEFTWCVLTKIYRSNEEWTVFTIQQFHCTNDIYPNNYPYFAGIKMQYLPLHTSLWVVHRHLVFWLPRRTCSKMRCLSSLVEELCHTWVFAHCVNCMNCVFIYVSHVRITVKVFINVTNIFCFAFKFHVYITMDIMIIVSLNEKNNYRYYLCLASDSIKSYLFMSWWGATPDFASHCQWQVIWATLAIFIYM